MTFQQCGSLCPQSCDSANSTCHSGCAEGCFCPDGQIVNGDGECADFAPCPSEKNIAIKTVMCVQTHLHKIPDLSWFFILTIFKNFWNR